VSHALTTWGAYSLPLKVVEKGELYLSSQIVGTHYTSRELIFLVSSETKFIGPTSVPLLTPEIVDDPNRVNDPQHIVRLSGMVTSVSWDIVAGLPELGIGVEEERAAGLEVA